MDLLLWFDNEKSFLRIEIHGRVGISKSKKFNQTRNQYNDSSGILSNWKEFEIFFCKINVEFVHIFQMFIIQDISRIMIQNSGFIKQKIFK